LKGKLKSGQLLFKYRIPLIRPDITLVDTIVSITLIFLLPHQKAFKLIGERLPVPGDGDVYQETSGLSESSFENHTQRSQRKNYSKKLLPFSYT
jgi:hypothetical protein